MAKPKKNLRTNVSEALCRLLPDPVREEASGGRGGPAAGAGRHCRPACGLPPVPVLPAEHAAGVVTREDACQGCAERHLGVVHCYLSGIQP